MPVGLLRKQHSYTELKACTVLQYYINDVCALRREWDFAHQTLLLLKRKQRLFTSPKPRFQTSLKSFEVQFQGQVSSHCVCDLRLGLKLHLSPHLCRSLDNGPFMWFAATAWCGAAFLLNLSWFQLFFWSDCCSKKDEPHTNERGNLCFRQITWFGKGL